VPLVEGKQVGLEFDRQRKDTYKLLLAYVYVGDMMLNAELVRIGAPRLGAGADMAA
jgi:endonuclease YncB( thermonuclease family)